ncbi:hypothetical protein C0Q70_05367 [Pomacea canaliculata]|uniref:Uncharacterized protein n=1 Tax=Pomacea canaliculata TaxID=400727 RepID=A0A2T7PL28_POMCA|nr:hypothetical protein C0Q70_05367 [Pomacea canaliculata]
MGQNSSTHVPGRTYIRGDNSDKDSVKPRPQHARTNSETFVALNKLELSRSNSMQEKHTNAMSFPANGHVKVDPVSRSTGQDSDQRRGVNGVGLKQTSSLFDRSRPVEHRRFPSASISLASKDSVIMEDPSEHQETSGPSGSGVTSLPVKNSFDLDYSFNLTYAQLAEFRRQSRQADLENRVDKRVADIVDDREKNSPQDTSVGRSDDQFSLASASSQGSDLGVGKSKKRQAPPPPGARQKDNNPEKPSLTAEPPADYDFDELTTTSQRKFSLQSQASSSSSSSRTSKGPAPKIPSRAPPAFSPPPIPQQIPPAVSAASKVLISTSTPTFQVSGQGKTTDGDAGVRQAAHRTDTEVNFTARAIADARAELEALEKLKAALKHVEDDSQQTTTSVQQAATPMDNSQHTHAAEEGMSSVTQNKYAKHEAEHHSPLTGRLAGAEDVITDTADSRGQTSEHNIPSVATSVPSVPSTKEEQSDMNGKSVENNEKSATPRKLSSLLQHDIVMTVERRSEKSLVKTRMSADPPRPKDQHALFREELEKASRAREERRNNRKLEDSQRALHVSLIAKSEELKLDTKTMDRKLDQGLRNETDLSLVSSVAMRDSHLPGGSSKAEQSVSEPNPDQDMNCSKGGSGWTSAPVVMNGVIDLSDEEGVVTSAVEDNGSVQTRTFSKDWKPEDDLDSDDDIMDDTLYSRNSVSLETSNGFKSSVLSSRIDDMKSRKRSELKKAEYLDEYNKRGQKFRKSMHESFTNSLAPPAARLEHSSSRTSPLTWGRIVRKKTVVTRNLHLLRTRS